MLKKLLPRVGVAVFAVALWVGSESRGSSCALMSHLCAKIFLPGHSGLRTAFIRRDTDHAGFVPKRRRRRAARARRAAASPRTAAGRAGAADPGVPGALVRADLEKNGRFY